MEGIAKALSWRTGFLLLGKERLPSVEKHIKYRIRFAVYTRPSHLAFLIICRCMKDEPKRTDNFVFVLAV